MSRAALSTPKRSPSQTAKPLTAEAAFREALQRVGVGETRNAEWFVRFKGLDLRALPEHELVTVWQDLLALCVLASRPRTVPPHTPLSDEERQRWQWAVGWPLHEKAQGNAGDYQPWKHDIERIWERINAALDEALLGKKPIIWVDSIALQEGRPVFPLTAWRVIREGVELLSAEGGVMVQLSKVLGVCTGRIKRCAAFREGSRSKCRGLFVASGRADRKTCSNACRVLLVMRKRQANKQDERRKRTKQKGGRHGKKGW
jgi:hypothetical protein